MAPSVCRRMVCIAGFWAIAATAEGAPFLPSAISVGAGVTGSVSLLVSSSPPDLNPLDIFGRYVVPDSSAQMVVRVGDVAFSSTPGELLVRVTDLPENADFIQFDAAGDETTFFPFLTGFARPNPSLDPIGSIGLNFKFPHIYLSSDAFPTSIDPLATVPFSSSEGGIIGGVEATSTQKPREGIREWAFGFDVDPSSMNFILTEGVLSSTFSGTIFDVDDRAVIGPPVLPPIPEPASLILVMSGLFVARQVTRRRGPK